jgi:hypothetical protein
MAFKEPNFTQVPNELLGNFGGGDVSPGLLSQMDECELKVVLVLCRITIGYHRTSAPATKTWLCKMTGLSWPSVQKGLRAATDRGLVKSNGEDERTGSAVWEILIAETEKDFNAITETINPIDTTIKLVDSNIKDVHTINKEKEKERKGEGSEIVERNLDSTPKVSNPIPLSKSKAVKKYEEITSLKVNKQKEDSIDQCVREQDKWDKVIRDWVSKGYNPSNVKGMLDVYSKGWREERGKDNSYDEDAADIFEEYLEETGWDNIEMRCGGGGENVWVYYTDKNDVRQHTIVFWNEKNYKYAYAYFLRQENG